MLPNLQWTLDGDCCKARFLLFRKAFEEELHLVLRVAAFEGASLESHLKHAEFLVENFATVENAIEISIHGATIPIEPGDVVIVHDVRCAPNIMTIAVTDLSDPHHAAVTFVTGYPDPYFLYTAELNMLRVDNIHARMW